MAMRPDGSLQSSNTPTYDNVGSLKEDFSLYRCMITKVLYVDDPNNITQNAQNPEVLYEAVILGGFKSGQRLSNIRLGTDLGGSLNRHERTLTAATQSLSDTRLSDQDGDIVYVLFTQGHQGYPVIIALGNGISDGSAASSATGPLDSQTYNGITQVIDKNGNLTITQKNGSTISISKTDKVTITTDAGLVMTLDGSADKMSVQTSNGAQLLVDGDSDTIEAKDTIGGTLKISNGKVGLGNSAAELVDILSQTLQLLATDLGNLGYPLANSAQYAILKTKITLIKGGI